MTGEPRGTAARIRAKDRLVKSANDCKRYAADLSIELAVLRQRIMAYCDKAGIEEPRDTLEIAKSLGQKATEFETEIGTLADSIAEIGTE